jgi:hypothetical protein
MLEAPRHTDLPRSFPRCDTLLLIDALAESLNSRAHFNIAHVARALR